MIGSLSILGNDENPPSPPPLNAICIIQDLYCLIAYIVCTQQNFPFDKKKPQLGGVTGYIKPPPPFPQTRFATGRGRREGRHLLGAAAEVRVAADVVLEVVVPEHQRVPGVRGTALRDHRGDQLRGCRLETTDWLVLYQVC